MNTIECDGNEVVLWTVEQDREILQYCKTAGARSKTFRALSKSFVDKTEKEVSCRLITLLTFLMTFATFLLKFVISTDNLI